MVGDFEQKLVKTYIKKNYPECEWVFYVIKNDIMTISYRDSPNSELCEVSITFNELIDSYKYGSSI